MQRSAAIIIILLLAFIIYLLYGLGTARPNIQVLIPTAKPTSKPVDAHNLQILLKQIKADVESRPPRGPEYTITIFGADSKPATYYLARANGLPSNAAITDIGDDYICLQAKPSTAYVLMCLPFSSIVNVSWG